MRKVSNASTRLGASGDPSSWQYLTASHVPQKRPLLGMYAFIMHTGCRKKYTIASLFSYVGDRDTPAIIWPRIYLTRKWLPDDYQVIPVIFWRHLMSSVRKDDNNQLVSFRLLALTDREPSSAGFCFVDTHFHWSSWLNFLIRCTVFIRWRTREISVFHCV